MGSESSNLVSSESSSSSRKLSRPSSSMVNRAKRKISSLFCGVFTPKSTFQKLNTCPKYLNTVDAPQNPVLETSDSRNEDDPPRESVSAVGDAIASQAEGSTSYNVDAIAGYNSSELRSLSIISDSLPRFRFPGDDDDVSNASSSGFLVSNSDQGLVSISTNFLSGDINERETRREGGRVFWEALSRRSFRERDDDARPGDQRWSLRSQVTEILGGQQTAFCASGLHLDGTCSCDSFFTAEESSSLASISRIIMLAEALFEVLDEIHRQSSSLSVSSISLPAPGSVVDTFPLKYYQKVENDENDSSYVKQCYICLADYEEGDKLRVLPCNHQYHALCIDKWLKDVNRVCPVCRHNVCEGPGECSVTSRM